jgi:acyl-coenzyme A synthetase/AMP-(fatty) acid ligase
VADTQSRLAHSRTSPVLPLIWRDAGGPFARIAGNQPVLGGRTGDITTAEFLSHCLQLAARLPAHRFVLNLCDNPYLFTVAFCAALIRRQTTLLPQNRSPETLRRLAAEYSSHYLLHNSRTGDLPDLADLPQVNLNQWRLTESAATAVQVEEIERDFPAAIAFTSGSTGLPKAIVKPWHTLVTSSLMNGACMLPPAGDLVYQLATVPPQHMWGLETGVLIPLFWPVCVADSRPMFPADLVKTLAELPTPRLLVSTPVHLRALLGSNLPIPECSRTLCATAPLATDLAVTCEAATGGDLLEIYGCSEIGSTAFRRTATDTLWRLIPGLSFQAASGAEAPRIGGQHLAETQLLQDRVEVVEDGFRLLGRNEDMVNVGGKRGSLMQISQVLLSTPGIADAVVFMPDDNASRPAALVVAELSVSALSVPALSVTAIQQHFALHLDPVFLPRPLVFVERLPREDTGKIHRANVLALYRDTLAQANKP